MHTLPPLALALALVGCSGSTSKDTGKVVDTDTAALTDNDGDGYLSDEDCDDANSQTHPGAMEVCDGVDNNCDGQTDEEVRQTWYEDADGDGFGNPDQPILGCSLPAGAVAGGTDCDDTNASAYPGGIEVCDGVDNDCDGQVDEDTTNTWYLDADGDGYGDPGSSRDACDAPASYVADDTDCDDTTSAAHPGATEICDGMDNNCDGAIDEGGSADPLTWYEDRDEDGYGDPARTEMSCTAPAGYVADNTDCDDLAVGTYPGAPEFCDGIDTNCDGSADAGATGTPTWYADADGDGYGDPAASTAVCDAPAGTVSNADDCDDTRSGVHPGAAEVCDGIDDDCDGVIDEDSASDAATWYADADGDGFGDPSIHVLSCSAPSGYGGDATDCDDADPAVNPDASELCDGIDNDCNGGVDDGAALDASTWFADTDADGYGDIDSTKLSCSEPSGYTADTTDCDDHNSTVHPGATETCNGIDDDCDGLVDEGSLADATTWYEDSDGDAYGDALVATTACDAPSGYVADKTDCDDADASVHPGATEYCDGTDDDCDGDEDGAVTYTSDLGVRLDVSGVWSAGTSSAPAALTVSGSGTYEICPGTYYVTAKITGSSVSLDGLYGSASTVLSGGRYKPTLTTAKALTITGLTLADGEAGSGSGGNLYTSSTLTADDLVLDGGSATKGGNLYCTGCTLLLTNTEIIGGDATSGGGIYVSSGTLTATDLVLDSNTAANGGDLYGTGLTGTLTSSAISGGSATSYGGGVYLTGSSSLSLSGSEITENASDQGGGAYVASSTLAISSGSNIDSNSATLLGGGAYLGASGTLTCSGSSGTTAGIWGNIALAGGGVWASTSASLTSTTCDWTATSDNSLYDVMMTIYYYNYGNNVSFSCTGYSCS